MMHTATPSPAAPPHEGPAPAFEAPFEMLHACHQRARHSLRLMQRLQQHVELYGIDAPARGAAAEVLRHFDFADPAHHEDEELHVLPRLRALGRDAMAERLQAEHLVMGTAWACLRPILVAVSHGQGADGLKSQSVTAFVRMHRHHMDQEELLAYPEAAAGLDAAAQ